MKTYARIQDAVVAELLATDGNIDALFHPELTWVDVTTVVGVADGWSFDGTTFSPPTPPALAAVIPSLADLQARLFALSTELQALAKPGQAATVA